MFKKVFLTSVLLTTSQLSYAGLVNSITGADMAGMQVTATFADNSTESFVWNSLSSNLGTTGNDIIDHEGFSGGVFGSNWSLTQQGYTLGEYDNGTVYGAWSFTDNTATNAISQIKIESNGSGVVFDTESIDSLSEDTNGSGQGRSAIGFIGNSAYTGFTATYEENVQQELFSSLILDFINPGTSFDFWADTDKDVQGADPEVEIDIDEIVDVDNDDFANVVIEEVAQEVEDLSNSVSNAADTAFDNAITNGDTPEEAAAASQAAAESEIVASQQAAQTSGEPSTVLETIVNDPVLLEIFSKSPELIEEIANFDIANLPSTGTPEEEEKLAAIIEVAEELLEEEIKEDWDVEGNGEIDVEVNREDGQLSIGLEVADPDDLTAPLEFFTLLDTPLFAFNVNFDLGFETNTGSLMVWLEDSLLASYDATDYFENPTSISLLVTDSNLFGLTDATLLYQLFPGSPASAFLSNINLSSVAPTDVPEPSTALVFLSGLLALVNFRRKS